MSYYGNTTIEKIKENEIKQIIDFKGYSTNLTKLEKGYSYNFTYKAENDLYLYLSKVEINIYDNLKYEKKFANSLYFFIDLNNFNNSIEKLYFFALIYTYIEVSKLNNENIKEIDLNKINYIEKQNSSRDILYAQFKKTIIQSKYILLKITFNTFIFNYLHIFENCIYKNNLQSIEINNKKEILLVVPDKYEFVIIFSNNTNIKSLRTFKIKKFDSSYISNPFFQLEGLRLLFFLLQFLLKLHFFLLF